MKTKQPSGFTLIEIMIVVAIIGILAAIAIPSLKRSLTVAQRQACAINQKNIDAAKVQWSIDNKKPVTDVPSETDLFGKESYLEHKPECPAGGQYELKPVCEKCECSVPGHVH